MTNLGFHRLMEERGIRVITTDVGDRYVLEALYREGGDSRRRAVGAHHLPARPRHRRRSRVGAAAVRRARRPDAVGGRRGRWSAIPQVKQNLPRAGRGPLPESLREQVDAVNAELDGGGRVLVRPSGTEPVVRVLAEAPTQEEAESLCARIASLVTQELG